MISGAPLSSTPIAGALALSSGSGTITLTPGAVIATWVVPSQTISGSGTASIAPSAVIATWVVPTQTIALAGTIPCPSAVATWVVPTQTLAGSGTAALAPDPVVATWVVPRQTFTGGIQGKPQTYGFSAFYNRAVAIVPSDTVNYDLESPPKPADGIYVGGAGVVVVVFENGTTMNITATAGQFLQFKTIRVNSTGTDATLMNALYQV